MRLKTILLASVVLATFAIVVSAVPSQQSKGYRDEVIKFMDEVWTKGNVAYIDQVMDPEFVRFGQAEEGNTVGIPDYKARVQQIRSAFTDYNVTLVDMMGVNDKATFTWKLRGNYVGPDKKISPGRAVDIMGKTVWFFRGDKVIREVVEMDQAEYHRQIAMAVPYSEIGNRALALSYLYEVLSKGNVSALPELVSEKHVLHDINGVKIVGIDKLRDHVLSLRAAFPDLSIGIYEVVAEGDIVMARWSITGTHRGKWNGIEPTGKKLEATGMSFMRIKDDKIQESWSVWDSMTLFGKPAGN